MVIDIKMCRFENAPWGFRLIGGSDFDVPLTVVKVTEESLADQAGLKVGDIIVRINDEPTCKMSHNDAHKVILHCGNTFFFGVLREEEEQDEQVIQENGVNYAEPDSNHLSATPDSLIRSGKSPLSDISDSHTEGLSEAAAVRGQSCENEKVTEDEIAEMMSAEAEVLQEHNVIGVNFNRIFPKTGICQSSEVFRTLNEEATKTKIEAEKEKRKWTTFLQKPNRPIPKSKQELEEEARRIPYRVHIVKQKKPKVAPDRIPSPPLPEPEPVKEEPQPEPEKEEEQLPPPTDNEVPNLEPEVSGKEDYTKEAVEEQETVNDIEVTEEVVEIVENKPDENILAAEPMPPTKTEEELLLEKQLADVQKQLMALSSLPSTIQATLDSVTKQLAELLPTFKLQPDISAPLFHEEHIANGPVDLSTSTKAEEEMTEVQVSIEEPETIQAQDEPPVEQEHQLKEINDVAEETQPIVDAEPTFEELERIRAEEERRKIEEELNYKRQKEREELKAELEQRLIRERTPKRPPRSFGPLTPQERPLILPGGRRWRTPKDAFNEEFIAEVLTSQAELIVGSTLGSTFESPLLGYDGREYSSNSVSKQLETGVNFLKYQKPEKKIDLEKSEVYKVVHHLEREPRRGIEVRPPKVLAEADIINRATPISCG